MLLVDHASRLEGLALDAFPVEQDGLAPAEMNVGWGQVALAVVAAAVVVLVYEIFDLRLEVARQVVVFPQDAVLQGVASALEVPLCLALGAKDFWLILTLLGVTMSQRSCATQSRRCAPSRSRSARPTSWRTPAAGPALHWPRERVAPPMLGPEPFLGGRRTGYGAPAGPA